MDLKFHNEICSNQKWLNGKTHREISTDYNWLLINVPARLCVAILRCEGLIDTDKSVLLCLCAHQWEDPEECVSTGLISIETGLVQRTVQKAIRRLQETGLVETGRCEFKGQKRTFRKVKIDALIDAFMKATNEQ